MNKRDTKVESSSAPKILNVLRHVLFAASLVLLCYVSRTALSWMNSSFNDPVEDMGHGWLVPIFSLYLIWRSRRELLNAVGSPSVLGALVLVPILILLWLGVRGDQQRVSQVAMIAGIWGVGYAFYGLRFARGISFPVIFLFFTVPLGFLDFVTVRLRLMTAALAAFMLNGLGLPIERVGTGLHYLGGAGFSLDVADPCSGLRSLFALGALTAGYAYLTQRSLWQKMLLFACAVPLAILGNFVRIFTIALVARFFGQEFATGFYHDYSGYLVFLVGFLLMIQAGAWIARLAPTGREEAEKLSSVGAPAGSVKVLWRYIAIVLVPGLLGLELALLENLPVPIIEPQDFLATEMPSIENYVLSKPWYCQNQQCRKSFEDIESDPSGDAPLCPECGGVLADASYGEKTYLPSDTLIMKGNYHGEGGSSYFVTVVVNGATRRSIHRPELCLPAQGYSIYQTQTRSLGLDGGANLPLKILALRRMMSEGGRNKIGQVYYFLSAHNMTSSHYMRMLISIRDRAFFNRVTRWAMVVMVSSHPLEEADQIAKVDGFLEKFNAKFMKDDKGAGAMARVAGERQ